MFKIIAVTNRKLCGEEFLNQIKKTAVSGVSTIILREKDLLPADYKILAAKVLTICEQYPVEIVLHTFMDVVKELNYPRIHLPLPVLEAKNITRGDFSVLGVSIHSLEQAKKAASLGATYLTAGHVFETDCKKGVTPRGLDFLSEIVEAVDIPVYAIGGIDERNIVAVKKTGVAGACVMSSMMKDTGVAKKILAKIVK